MFAAVGQLRRHHSGGIRLAGPDLRQGQLFLPDYRSRNSLEAAAGSCADTRGKTYFKRVSGGF